MTPDEMENELVKQSAVMWANVIAEQYAREIMGVWACLAHVQTQRETDALERLWERS